MYESIAARSAVSRGLVASQLIGHSPKGSADLPSRVLGGEGEGEGVRTWSGLQSHTLTYRRRPSS